MPKKKRIEKRYVLKKDIVIKAGTVFKCIDGETHSFASDNYSCIFGLTKDSSGECYYGIDSMDKELEGWFEEIENA